MGCPTRQSNCPLSPPGVTDFSICIAHIRSIPDSKQNNLNSQHYHFELLDVVSPTMAMISPIGQERLLFLGLGITTCAVLALVRNRLIHFREAATIPPTENKSHFIDQKTEDSLKLGTLNKLLNNPNYGIQETASIIVCERAIHNEFAINTLLYEISRPEYDRRERAIRALIMMVNGCMYS